jgi:hypothetical protein
VRFFGITTAVAGVCIVTGSLLARRRADAADRIYRRAVAPYALVVLVVVVITSFLMR